jgi:hypothetical protein
LHDDFYLRFVPDPVATGVDGSGGLEAELHGLAKLFAVQLCDPLGSGIISLTQLTAYLHTFTANAGCVEAGKCIAVR